MVFALRLAHVDNNVSIDATCSGVGGVTAYAESYFARVYSAIELPVAHLSRRRYPSFVLCL